MELKVDLRAYDVGTRTSSHDDIVRSIVLHTEKSWSDGADVVVFPEYVWLLLEQFVAGEDKIHGVAQLFWETVWPELLIRLSRPDKAVVLGTVPYLKPDGKLLNRSPILAGGKVIFQDKLCLTPWESVFSGGDAIHVWQFKGAKFVVLVCLDIEVPELAVALRGKGVDVILVPSATETMMGVERIGRCASARSVELCCYVGVAHLTGSADSELVDKNVGRAAWFTPSQSAFENHVKMLTSDTVWAGYERQVGEIDLPTLARCRLARIETNPALLSSGLMQNILVQTVEIS